MVDLPSQRFPRTLAKPLLQIGSERAAHTRPGSRRGWDGLRRDAAERTIITFFTFATGAVPGFPQGGTAVRLQRGPVDVDLAAVIDNLEPAGALDRLCVL